MKGVVGLGHVAIKLADLDRSLDYYVNKLGFPEMMWPAKDDGSAWLQDPDRNRVELMEMASDSLPYRAIERLHSEGAVG